MSEEEAVSLFEGKKFWIAQRVPTRNHWIELLEVRINSKASHLTNAELSNS